MKTGKFIYTVGIYLDVSRADLHCIEHYAKNHYDGDVRDAMTRHDEPSTMRGWWNRMPDQAVIATVPAEMDDLQLACKALEARRSTDDDFAQAYRLSNELHSAIRLLNDRWEELVGVKPSVQGVPK